MSNPTPEADYKQNDLSKITPEVLHKEIDLIQACITRMANNSFLIKGWAISLVAVVLALVEKAIQPAFLSAIVLIPLLSFWYLDAFFIYTERLYRKMYEWVINQRLNANSEKIYDLNPHRFEDQLKVRKWNRQTSKFDDTSKLENVCTVMWSTTLRYFYGIPVLIVIIIILSQVIAAIPTHSKTKPNSDLSSNGEATAKTHVVPTISAANKTNNPCVKSF
jgi:3'-phosphoadenosine 5'-phosphosulfate sulfotransferase (PAPS reductase)/FAD synthetase